MTPDEDRIGREHGAFIVGLLPPHPHAERQDGVGTEQPPPGDFDALRREAATAAGLDPALASRLRGATSDELAADARALAADLPDPVGDAAEAERAGFIRALFGGPAPEPHDAEPGFDGGARIDPRAGERAHAESRRREFREWFEANAVLD